MIPSQSKKGVLTHHYQTSFFEEWFLSFGVYVHRRRLEILRSLLSGKEFRSALDVGCGNGLLTSVGMHGAVGLDIKASKATTVLASAEHLPFTASCFDLVTAGEVLEHLQDPVLALQDWTRVLRQGGTIIVSTPNGNLVKTDVNPEHKRTYSPRDLKRTLEKLGLTVNASQGTLTGLISGRRLFKWIPFDTLKMGLTRFPTPLPICYDFFVRAVKGKADL